MNTSSSHGSKIWFFPDGDLPPVGAPGNPMHGHESLVLFNPNDADAHIAITVYYTESEPHTFEPLKVAARRVRCVRTDEGLDGYQIPPGQYALKVESDTPIICQIGRADVRQSNLAYYTTMGFAG